MDTLIMNLHEQLLSLSQSMLTMINEEDWKSFYKAEEKRENIMAALRKETDHSDYDPTLIQSAIDLQYTLEKELQTHKSIAQQAILKLQKGKKANQFYSNS